MNIKDGKSLERRSKDPAKQRRSLLEWRRNNPEKVKAYKRKWLARNADRVRAVAKKWRHLNPSKVKAWEERSKESKKIKRQMKTFGITREQRDAFFNENNGKCLICNLKMSTCLDHDHSTGRVRGALCHACNLGIANLQENPTVLRNAAKYLEKARVG